MGPYYCEVTSIQGEYAYLFRTDTEYPDEPMVVAMALLPEGIDVGDRLKWENLEYVLL